MAVSFHILPARGLVYVRYEGLAEIAPSLAVFAEYARHPDRRPGQKQLVDLSRVTGFERDFAQLFEFQAKKAEVFMNSDVQTLIAYYAPNDAHFGMARLIQRSWEPFNFVVARVLPTEADTLAFLGQNESSIAELLERAI